MERPSHLPVLVTCMLDIRTLCPQEYVEHRLRGTTAHVSQQIGKYTFVLSVYLTIFEIYAYTLTIPELLFIPKLHQRKIHLSVVNW